MSDLAEFLLARIAEDEAVARGAVRWSEGASQWADDGEPDWQHIARHDPARVLADIDAKRRIVERYQKIQGRRQDGDLDERLTLGWVLEQMAQPYAAHPDYREGWRP